MDLEKELLKNVMRSIALLPFPNRPKLPYKDPSGSNVLTIVSGQTGTTDTVLEKMGWIPESPYTNLLIAYRDRFEVLQEPVSVQMVKEFQGECGSLRESLGWMKTWFEEELNFPPVVSFDYFH